MDTLKAEDRLQRWLDGEIELHPNTLYEVAKEARDEDTAQRYFSAAVKARLRSE